MECGTLSLSLSLSFFQSSSGSKPSDPFFSSDPFSGAGGGGAADPFSDAFGSGAGSASTDPFATLTNDGGGAKKQHPFFPFLSIVLAAAIELCLPFNLEVTLILVLFVSKYQSRIDVCDVNT